MHEIEIPVSGSFAEATEAFLTELREWAQESIEAFDETGPSDGHDQVNFTLAWAPLIHDGDWDLLDVMQRWRDEVRDRFVASEQWHHGYWCKQEAHHGTEHFDLFLGTLYRLSPDDPETRRQIQDACEHIGNWVRGVPEWFDWGTGLFRSMWLGTREVKDEPAFRANVADHMRLVNLSLLGFEATGNGRYFEVAGMHAGRWAQAILDGPCLPVALLPGGPLYAVDEDLRKNYHGFAGMAGSLADDVDRAENLLASGAIDAFLMLHRLTQEEAWLEATRRLLDVLVTQVADPDSGAAVQAIMQYRLQCSDWRYDDALALAYREAEWGAKTLGVQPMKREGPRPAGIGKRSDKPDWFEDGEPRKLSPLLLAAIAEICESEELARQAMDLGQAYLRLARQALPGDCRHACGANSVAAVARGHGRENNAGVVTGVLQPLMDVFGAGPDIPL
jgi:hypothetical protein